VLLTSTLPAQGIKPLIKAKILAKRKAFRDSQFRQWLLLSQLPIQGSFSQCFFPKTPSQKNITKPKSINTL
jgi:hypothetical protein